MNAREFANIINGREYGSEITKQEEAAAKESGIVVVFGYSDDNVELRGAIDDEIYAYGDTKIYLTKDGVLKNECGDNRCPYFEKLKETATVIMVHWGTDGYSWTYDAQFPYETFEILEDVEKYCRGIVFMLADI